MGCSFWNPYNPRGEPIASFSEKECHFQMDRYVDRAVASLTVPGGQEFHFPQFFLKFWSFFSYLSSNFTYFLPHFGPPGGESPTREGPGYATLINSKIWSPLGATFWFNPQAPSNTEGVHADGSTSPVQAWIKCGSMEHRSQEMTREIEEIKEIIN